MSEADGEYKRTTGECSLPHSIQHIHKRSVNPRWNEEFHIRKRPVHHSPVPYPTFQEVEQIIEEALGKPYTLLQKQQSACESRQDASHGVSSAEQRDQQVATSIMEWSGPGEQIQNPFLTAQSTQIKSVISVPIKDFINHYPRASTQT